MSKLNETEVIAKEVNETQVNETQVNTELIIINKGTGAGGANTNHYGKKFE